MFRSIGPLEIGLILIIVLIFFGVGKLPQVGSALGKGLRAFKRGQSGDTDDAAVEEEVAAASPKKATRLKKAANKGS